MPGEIVRGEPRRRRLSRRCRGGLRLRHVFFSRISSIQSCPRRASKKKEKKNTPGNRRVIIGFFFSTVSIRYCTLVRTRHPSPHPFTRANMIIFSLDVGRGRGLARSRAGESRYAPCVLYHSWSVRGSRCSRLTASSVQCSSVRTIDSFSQKKESIEYIKIKRSKSYLMPSSSSSFFIFDT